MKQGYLILETGEIFEGKLYGGKNGHIFGEVVFNTSMTGYQEIVTDPSYAGQIIVFTYPLIGNYGVEENSGESGGIHARAVIVKELFDDMFDTPTKSPFLNLLEKYDVPCLAKVDTRKLVTLIRDKGTVKGLISDHIMPFPSYEEESSLLNQVTTKKVAVYENNGPHIVLLDFGYKKSILHYLLSENCKVTIVPYSYPIEKIKELKPDGVVISNGPGDPRNAADQLEKIMEITETYPTLGICLGHQLIALAHGAKIGKLLFGHRGGNHPVKDLKTGKVYITSQNHGYVVEDLSVNESEFDVSFINVTDGTIEGLRHKRKPVISVQFHPEGHPGPLDTVFIFKEFIHSLNYKGQQKISIPPLF